VAGRQRQRLLHDLARTQRTDRAVRQPEGPEGHELRLPARGRFLKKRYFRDLHHHSTAACLTIYPGFTDKFWTYKYDPEMAKALLKEGRPVVGFLRPASLTTRGDPVQEPIAILYQTALRDIGVELELKKNSAGHVL